MSSSDLKNMPNGTTTGLIELERNSVGRYDLMIITRHEIGTRSVFWERSFLRDKDGSLRLVQALVTDPIWGSVAAREYIGPRIEAKIRSGFLLKNEEGNVGR